MLSQEEQRKYWKSRNDHFQQWDKTVTRLLLQTAEEWQLNDSRVDQLQYGSEWASTWGVQTPFGPVKEGWMLTGKFKNRPLKLVIKLLPSEEDGLSVEEYSYSLILYSMSANTPSVMPGKAHSEKPETAGGLENIFKDITRMGPEDFAR